MKRTILFVLCLVLLMPVAAQEDQDDTPPNYLLDMLSLIPDTSETRADFLSYVDIDGIEQARRTPINPPNNFVFNLLPSESNQLWLEATRRIMSGPQELQNAFSEYEAMPDVVGFSYFAIDRAISFGQPPTNGFILGGSFDADDVGDAHANRGYEPTDVEGYTAWCGPDGCESGFEVDRDNLNRANIFDPQLGRARPVLVLPGYLGTSGAFPLIEDMADAANGTRRTLADVPNYRAAAEAVTDPETFSGTLLQANFLSYDPINDVDLTLFESREQYEELLEGGMPNMPELQDQFLAYGELPTYLMSVLADRFDGEETNQAIIALVYFNEANAQAATEELTNRLENFALQLRRDEEPSRIIDFVSGAEVDEPYVYQSEETGLFVAVASISYPLPTVEGVPITQSEVPEGFAPPGQAYRLWIQAVFQRQFYPTIQVNLPDWAYETE